MYRLAISLLSALCIGLIGSISAQKSYKVSIGFYNLENLFDTIDNDNKDEDYLPTGLNAWTEERYQMKLTNMAYAISQMAGGYAPDILGVCEVENRNVLEDLVMHPHIIKMGYQIIHFDSPDYRGIDVALLYRPKVFKFGGANSHAVHITSEPHVKTRDILEVNGSILGEKLSILIAHWPSRAGGEQLSLNRRMSAAQTMRRIVDSLQDIRPEERIILMGDLNDDPTSPSLTEGLRSLNKKEAAQHNTDLVNIMAHLHRSGYGTLAYRDVWNLFDNIIVTANLLGKNPDKLRVQIDKQTNAYGRIYNASFLTQATGHYKGYPFRTMSNGQFQNGYSDHFPVYMYLVKSAK